MRSIYLMKSALLGALLTAGTAYAQISGADLFLQGNYVEVGVGTLGYYGSASNAPTGYHPHMGTSNHLGFVSDPGMDGWTVGTPPMMGDYFLPGMPFEGWELQENGKRIQGFNMGTGTFSYGGGMPAATGSNTAYTTVGTSVIGTWQGTIDSMTFKQETTIDAANLYFTTKVTITNLASTPKNDIYYFRTLDPDNDQTWSTCGGGFSTTNTITHQMPNVYNVSSVKAVGACPSSTLILGTTFTNSRAVIYNSWPVATTVDLATIYGGTYTPAYYDESGVHTGDIAIGLLTYIPHIASVDSAGDSVLRTTSSATLHPANTASFTFFYAFSQAAADSAIVHINAANTPDTTSDTTVISHTAVSSVNKTDIRVFPNPVYGTLNITGLNINDRYSLFDMMGRNVASGIAITTGMNSLSLHDIAAGNYVLIATDANGNIKYRQPVRKQ